MNHRQTNEPQMNAPQLELVSHHLCPYVQRAVIILLEKNIPHKRTYIDLNSKPEWFSKISATGKVPLLIVDDCHILFESMVICEYLDEITPGSLHPVSSLSKAQHRAWNEFASQILNNIAQLYNAKKRQDFIESSEQLANKFQRLEREVILPYFSGDQFCMTDAAFGPVFRYFDVMEQYFEKDILSGLNKTKQWRETLAQRDSVQQAVGADYYDRLTEFLLKRRSYISDCIHVPQASIVL
ncbi:glutathione S-transferase family protein [Alkalimarinus coralli]|uniref:glutathione S-transferase family protein n=1 Tax=Alkalimarinus coralli TaxID=2935863 RepID=UPI00202B035D|nr:glutathione S-transferase family protein [Alkalimarinus coralli]